MKIYTAEEVAASLKVETRTVLHLIKRGLLHALPGIRHKRITEEEFHRYLGVKGVLESASSIAPSALHTGPGQTVVQPTGHSARPSSAVGVNQGTNRCDSNGEGSGAACRVVKPKGKK